MPDELTLNDYQEKAEKTSGAYGEGENEERLLAALVGLGGEAGEALNKIKKRVWHRHHIGNAEIAEELGDALWYIAEACHALGWSLDSVARANLHKLATRYQGEFTYEKSRERDA